MSKLLRRAVYAGNFDPPTNGHLWMIREAQKMFDEVIVAIGVNPDKKSTYSISERQQCEAITCTFPNVRITTFEKQFLVNYAHGVNAKFILRGIHTPSDYEYERSIRYINSDLPGNHHRIFNAAARICRSVIHHGQRHG